MSTIVRPRVIVAGSANMDCIVQAKRLPGAGETVPGDDILFLPGGKGANQAVAAARMGAEVVFSARLGDDNFGAQLKAALTAENIDLTAAKTTAAKTGAAFITVADGQNTIVVVSGANAAMSPETADDVHFRAGDWLLAQLEIPQETVLRFFRNAKNAGAFCLLNPSPADDAPRELLSLSDLLVLNEMELALLCAHTPIAADDAAAIEQCARTLAVGGNAVIVTRGMHGALGIDKNGAAFRVPGISAKTVDTTGAGDCFAGALATALCEGMLLSDAAQLANRAAAASTEKIGAIPSLPRRTALI